MEPQYLNGARGRLFTVFHPPRVALPSAPRCIVVQPFAEELNKSRRTVALLAHALADAGIATLVLDLFGTGDSDGEFEQATWQGWHRDIACAVEHMAVPGSTLILLGLRLGATLVADFVAAHPRTAVARLILWQPMPSGKLAARQFFRLALAAEMREGAGDPAAGVKRARENLEVHGVAEIAGYRISRELVASMEEVTLKDLRLAAASAVSFYEVRPADQEQPSPALNAIAAAWSEQGLQVETRVVADAAFWTTAEITTGRALIDATIEDLQA